jgi:hypothetical protein
MSVRQTSRYSQCFLLSYTPLLDSADNGGGLEGEEDCGMVVEVKVGTWDEIENWHDRITRSNHMTATRRFLQIVQDRWLLPCFRYSDSYLHLS